MDLVDERKAVLEALRKERMLPFSRWRICRFSADAGPHCPPLFAQIRSDASPYRLQRQEVSCPMAQDPRTLPPNTTSY